MNKLMFTAAMAAVTGVVSAQEMGATVATQQSELSAVSVAVGVAETVATTAAKIECQTGAQEIVDKTVEAAPKMTAIDSCESVSAEELVEKKLGEVGLTSGYDRVRRAIIQIGVGAVKVENPPADKNFMFIREGMAQYAYMNAKADIIRSINTEFSAIDRVMTTAEFGEDETARKFAEKKGELEGKRDQLAAMLAEVKLLSADDEEAVKRVSIGERFSALMDAVIKKVDSEYDPKVLEAKHQALSEERKAKIAELREKCCMLAAEYKQLESEANALKKDPALETASDVKILSEMPLLGSSVLTQAETWDPQEKIFTVAMAVVWSPTLQEQALMMVADDFKPMSGKGKYSVKDWIDAQEFSHMIGPRRFTDKDGMNLFVGCSSVDLNMPVVKQNAAKKLADAMAMKYVAFSLAGDLATYREASQNLKVYEDDTNGAMAKLKDTVNAQVTLNLNGCMRLAGKTVRHPLLNRKIYVSAYYIDPALAKDAKMFMSKIFNDAGIARVMTKQKQAYSRGAQAMLKRIDAMPITPVYVPSPVLPPMPVAPKLVKPVSEMTADEKTAAKKAFEEHRTNLLSCQKEIVERSRQIEIEKRTAMDSAQKSQLEKVSEQLDARQRAISAAQVETQGILTKLYQAIDPGRIDLDF